MCVFKKKNDDGELFQTKIEYYIVGRINIFASENLNFYYQCIVKRMHFSGYLLNILLVRFCENFNLLLYRVQVIKNNGDRFYLNTR